MHNEHNYGICDIVQEEDLFLLLKTLISIERETLNKTVSLLIITGKNSDLLIDIIRRLPKNKVSHIINYATIRARLFLSTGGPCPELTLFEEKLLYTEIPDFTNLRRDIQKLHSVINRGITYRNLYHTDHTTMIDPGTLVISVTERSDGEIFATTPLKRNPVYIHTREDFTISDRDKFINGCASEDFIISSRDKFITGRASEVKALSNVTEIYKIYRIFGTILKNLEDNSGFSLPDALAYCTQLMLSTLPPVPGECVVNLFRHFITLP